MYRRKLTFFAYIFIAVLAAVVLRASSTKAASISHVSTSQCGSWQIVPSPTIGSGTNTLLSVTTVSTHDVWAVGYYLNTSARADQTLVEHWNGTNWQVVTSPNAGAHLNYLEGVTAVSANDIWAVGYSQSSRTSPFQTLIEHWNGTNWSVVSSPNVGDSDNLLSVSAASAGNVWAVGEFFPTASGVSQTLIEHWNGSSWSIVTSPNVGTSYNTLFAVTVVSASNAWTVGSYDVNSISQTLTEHWNGNSWSVVTSPNRQADNQLSAVAAVSTNTIWAVGNSVGGPGSFQTLTEQWNGTRWSIVNSSNVMADFNYLFGVAVVSASDVWAVGASGSFIPSTSYTLIEHWNGTQWSLVSSPGPGHHGSLNAVATTGGTVWAVGDRHGQTLIESHC